MNATTSPWDLNHIGVVETELAFELPPRPSRIGVEPSKKTWDDRARELEAQAQQIPFASKTPRYLPPGMKVQHTIRAGMPFRPHPSQQATRENRSSAGNVENVPPSRLMLISTDTRETPAVKGLGMAFEMSQHQGLFVQIRIAKGSAGHVSIGKDIPAILIRGAWHEEGRVVRWVTNAENRLLWEDETFVYSLNGNIQLEELLKVAASL